uniref:Uncharacterized protein n=1 Tax=Cyprinodon variegatus TaxID=28743 RepID=A0A3Q2GBK2_CYPVA
PVGLMCFFSLSFSLKNRILVVIYGNTFLFYYWEAEAGGSFELRSSELQCTMPIGCPTWCRST